MDTSDLLDWLFFMAALVAAQVGLAPPGWGPF
jgi:hypothetical protein